MTSQREDDLISVREAARECGRNMETVRRWIWGGKLPAQKLGNQLFIKRSDFAGFCRETAIREYEAKPRPDFPERAIVFQERLKAKGVKPIDTAEEIRKMREERMNELEQRLPQPETMVKPGSKANLIKRMRKLRESIRTRVGNLDAAGTIEQLREERMNELTRLR
ncbi:MAG: helix-turn-helix domain-containing protein [Chloroflexi bacterium]|nr:helix-turn-helix domain-containing protein [Chloroflexota bacterium]